MRLFCILLLGLFLTGCGGSENRQGIIGKLCLKDNLLNCVSVIAFEHNNFILRGLKLSVVYDTFNTSLCVPNYEILTYDSSKYRFISLGIKTNIPICRES